jgi:hypothetical protein
MTSHASNATAQLQVDVDHCVRLLETPWKATLTFEVASTSSRNPDRDTIIESLHLQDIASFLGGQKPQYLRLYFDPRKYKTTSSNSNNLGEGLPVQPGVTEADEQQQVDTTTTNNNAGSTQRPPPPDFLTLKKDIERAALEQHNENGSMQFPLFSNGASGGVANTRRFRCAASINRVNTKRQTALAIKRHELKHTYRQSDIINDRKNSRGPTGKSMIRRTNSVVSDKSCTFGFTLRWDEIGFYISLEKLGGCPFHRYHAPSNNAYSIPTRFLADDERQTLNHLAASCCNTGVGGAYIRSKLGRYMSKGKVAYVYSQSKPERLGIVDNDDSSPKSEYDHLTRYFESTKEIAYTVLWDVIPHAMSEDDDDDDAVSMAAPGNPPTRSSFLVSHTKLDNSNSCQKDHTDDESMVGLRMEGALCRDNQKVPDNTKIFIAIAWVFKPELRFFKLFPEVIHVDATSHSTNKKYDLLTFSVKTSTGRQVVFLRAWLPDQRRYSFRWVFQHVLTGLVPQEFFLRTRLVMSDGDRQQQQEIETAIRDYMPNAKLGSCGWHIVDRGWRRNGPTTNIFPGTHKKRQVNDLFKVVRRWIYSWMSPGYCENEDEFRVSARLLNEYIDSAMFRESVEGRQDVITHLKQFLRQNVLVHQELFLHYLKRTTRCFDIAHNSAHEGTNHGLKSNAAAVLPSHGPVAAAERMVHHAFTTTKEIEEEGYRTFRQNKQWSSLPTSAYLVQAAESILCQQTVRYQNYVVVRVGYALFEVSFVRGGAQQQSDIAQQQSEREIADTTENVLLVDELPMPFDDEDAGESEARDGMAGAESDSEVEADLAKSTSPIPIFNRTRTVSFDASTHEFTCSCCQFERIGIPCVHIFSVVKNLNPDWKGYTHHQVAVRWWSVYIANGYPLGKTSPTSRALASLASSDIVAPKIPSFAQILQNCNSNICTASTPQLAWERITNYDSEKLKKMFQHEGIHGDQDHSQFMGQSQTTYDPDHVGDEETSDDDLFDKFDTIADNESRYSLMERKVRSFLSLYQAMGSDDQALTDHRFDVFLSETRAVYSKNQKNQGGTISTIAEHHSKRCRTFNTHSPYYN